MEANPEIEFEHYLTQKLGGMTVGEMRERMGQQEFVYWRTYYARMAQREELERLKAR